MTHINPSRNNLYLIICFLCLATLVSSSALAQAPPLYVEASVNVNGTSYPVTSANGAWTQMYSNTSGDSSVANANFGANSAHLDIHAISNTSVSALGTLFDEVIRLFGTVNSADVSIYVRGTSGTPFNLVFTSGGQSNGSITTITVVRGSNRGMMPLTWAGTDVGVGNLTPHQFGAGINTSGNFAANLQDIRNVQSQGQSDTASFTTGSQTIQGVSTNATKTYLGETYSFAGKFSIYCQAQNTVHVHPLGPPQAVPFYNYVGSSDALVNLDIQVSGAIIAAPTNLTVTPVSSTKLNLAWNYGSDPIDGFAIERKTDNTSFVEINRVGPSPTSYPDTGLTANTTYTYRVRAFKGTDYSAYSNPEVTATTSPQPLVTITEQPKMHDDHTLRVDVTGVFSDDPSTSKSLSIKFELNGTQLDGTNCSDCKFDLPTGATGEFFDSFRVDLSGAGVSKFEDNQKFTITATATEGREESDPDIREVEIPLPVVHVHGILSDTLGSYIPNDLFKLLKDEHPAYNEDDGALLSATYPTLVSFPYNSLLQSNLLTGLDLAAWIRAQVLPRTYASKVNIVSHSMGGIITRSAIWYGGASGLINKAILVGSPSEGATLAPVAVRDWIQIITLLTILNTAARQLTSPLIQYTPGELADYFAILNRMAVAHNVTAKELVPTYGWWANTKAQALQGPLQIPIAYGNPFLANLNSLGLHPEVKWYAITASGKPTLTRMWGEFWLLTTIRNLATDADGFGPGDGIVPIQSQRGDDLGWSSTGPQSFKLIYDTGAAFHTQYFSRPDVNMKVEDIFWSQP